MMKCILCPLGPFSLAWSHIWLFTQQDWAKAGDINNLKMHWHIPNEEELKLVDRFLEEFLEPELIRLRSFINGEALERYFIHTRKIYTYLFIKLGLLSN